MPPSATSFDHRQVAALGVGVVAVNVAAKDQTALVGLADIKVPGAKGHHPVDQRLQPFGHEGLQDVAFNGQPHAGMGHDLGRRSRHRHADFFCADKSARRFHPADTAIFDPQTRDFALLDQVDAPARQRRGHNPTPPRHGAPSRHAFGSARP